MSMVKVRLVGCDRYNFKGELYEKGKVYMVGESKAQIMLRKEDEFNRPFFAVYVKPAKSRDDRIANAAAAAAAEEAARIAEEDSTVDRPDGSEPNDPDNPEVVVVDPEAAVEVEEEVDTDDDPALDEDGPANPEEVDVEEEDGDRDDGTAEEV